MAKLQLPKSIEHLFENILYVLLNEIMFMSFVLHRLVVQLQENIQTLAVDATMKDCPDIDWSLFSQN